MRAVVRRGFLVAAIVGGVGAAVMVACASDDPAAPAPLEAGAEASLLGDVVAPEPDADVPLGDVCGDAQGLEKDAPWPLRGGCPKRAGVTTSIGPRAASVKWSVPLPVGESSPAIAADRLLWVGTTDGDVIVLSANGIVQGGLHTGGPVRSSPARSASGLTIIGGTDGMLYGIERGTEPLDAGADADADAGDVDASAEGGAPFRPARAVFARAVAMIASSPAIGADGTIYVTAADGKLYAIAADGSALKWTATTNDTTGTSSPAIALDGTIYVGSSDKKLYAFTRAGATKWVYDAGAVSGSPVVGGDETVYVGAADGTLHAVAPDGKKRWTYTTGGPISGAPCVRGGVVFVGSDDKKLHAVSTTTGTKKWAYDTLGAVATPIVGADGTVYVGSADGNLYAITPSGLLFFAVKAKGRIHSAPAMGDDSTLYVTTDTALVAIGQ